MQMKKTSTLVYALRRMPLVERQTIALLAGWLLVTLTTLAQPGTNCNFTVRADRPDAAHQQWPITSGGLIRNKPRFSRGDMSPCSTARTVGNGFHTEARKRAK